MGTGSDTRTYNPRSESSRMYSADESRGDYRHGQGDPEDMERHRDKQQAQDEADKIKDLPHLKVEVEHQRPGLQEPLPPLPGAENEEPQMNEDENAVGAEVSQMTGMPGSMGAQLDQAVGAKTGTGSAMGGYRPLLATGEPMEAAWSELLKEGKSHITWMTPEKKMGWLNGKRGDVESWAANNPGGYTESVSHTYYDNRGLPRPSAEEEAPPIDPNAAERDAFQEEMFDEEGNLKSEPMEGAWSTLLKRARPWGTPQFDQTPSVRQPAGATKRMADIRQRILSSYGGKGGLDEAKTPLKRTHGGRSGAHAAHEFVAPYHQYLSTQAHRRRMGGIGLPGHGAREVGRGNPKITIHRLPSESKGPSPAMQTPKPPAASSVPKVPMAFKAELEEIQGLLLKAKNPVDYLHFSQLRSMLRRVKDLMERKESRLKATANFQGGPGEVGHRDGGTTTNHGGTETLDPEDDTKNWGASAAHLIARGSGRSA
jgi:hypothetical protein